MNDTKTALPEKAAPDPNSEGGKTLTRAVYDELQAFVKRLAETHQVWGLSIIGVCVQLFAMELRATDRKACGQYLRAIADLMDPPEIKIRRRGKHEFLTDAENRRRAALQTLLDKVHERFLAAELAEKCEARDD